MAPELDQFWNLVADSQLLGDEQFSVARDECQESNSNLAANWLVRKKLISKLHRDVLLSGHAGPFFYGRYVVSSRLKLLTEPAGFESFVATDRKTGYPVRLQFFDGRSPGALETWANLDRWVRGEAEQLATGVPLARTLEIYQAISLPDTRFVVRELPRGKTLTAAIPLKSRLGVPQAAKIMMQVAAAFTSETPQPLLMPVDPESLMNRLWIGAGKNVRFDPLLQYAEMSSDETLTDNQQRQAFLLGALLLRLVSGRQLPWSWNPKTQWFKFDEKTRDALIAKSEDETELETLLGNAISSKLESAIDVKQFAQTIGKISEAELAELKSTGQRAAFLHSLGNLDLPLGEPLAATVVSNEPIPVIDTKIDLSTTLDSFSGNHQESDDARVQAARTAAVKRHKSRSMRPAAIAGGLLIAVSCLAGWAFLAGGKSVPVVQLKPDTPIAKQEVAVTETATETEIAVEETPAPDYTSVSYLQTLVDDGEATLWESPTTGVAIELSWLPASTEILYHVRGKDLLADPGGQNLLKSLGPDFAAMRATFEERAGLAIAEMDSLTVAMLPDENRGYKPFFQITVSGTTKEQLVAAWGQPDELQLPGNHKLFAGDDDAWCFIEMSETDSDDNSLRFVFGEPRVVQQVIQDSGTVVLADALGRLVQKTDRERHFTLLTLASALTNENARSMWGQWSERLLPELRLAFPDQLRSFLVSLHVDDGEYVELHLDHSAGISSKDLAAELRQSIGETLSKVDLFSQSLAKTEYWQQLQGRFGSMLQELNSAIRWDTEFGQLIGNAWLPPNAAQNLLSASELTMTFSESSAVTEQKQLPNSIEELLAAKRSLNVTNPPDLNVLLSDIRAEILDDYPGLGFAFRIKLIGGDLQKEGITQNQRPGPMAITDQPLSAILTQIMTSANPDKTIAGPADPNCKLVWVVAQDPDDEANKAILITTRAAAEQKGYSLPGVFVEK